MSIYLPKTHAFFVSFLLFSASFPFLAPSSAMDVTDHTSLSPQNSQPKICLRDALDAFEKSQFEKASEIFTHLRKAGAMVSIKYLENLKKDTFLSDEPVPDAGLKLSEEFLSASLAYMNYMKTKNKKSLQKLGVLVLNNNAHALSLMRRLSQANQDIFKDLAATKMFRKMQSLDDLSKSFEYKLIAPTLPILFGNCLDPDNILALRYSIQGIFLIQALDDFSVEYEKAPELIGQLAQKLGDIYPQPFWVHLAVENGINAACLTLGDYCSGSRPDFSAYYTSQIQQEKLIQNTQYKGLLMSHGDYFYQKRDLRKACKYYKLAADQGNAQAQYNYALMRENGEGVEKDLSETLKYYKLAADQGFVKGQFAYACRRYLGMGEITKDLIEACQYFKLAADQGDAQAQCNYALMRENGEGAEKDLSETLKYYKLAADQGFVEGQHTYAWRRYSGMGGVTKDLIEACQYFKLAADQGNGEAQNNYAYMRDCGEGAEKDLLESLKYYKLAADQGHVTAQYEYARKRLMGEGGEKDRLEALKYYKLAADQGHVMAQHNCGCSLYKGEEGSQDLSSARKYYKLAADQGLMQAQYSYGLMCYKGEGVGKDEAEAKSEALKYCKLAADQGHAMAQYNYACMLYAGEDGSQDLSSARQYFKLAADQGIREAQYNYAKTCDTEEECHQNLAEARKYYKLAADQGEEDALYRYAIMCYYGKGGETNLEETLKYFNLLTAQEEMYWLRSYALMYAYRREEIQQQSLEKSLHFFKWLADQGDKAGQYNYALMCFIGEGCQKNLGEALKYGKWAADQGDKGAQYSYAGMCFQGEGSERNIEEARKYYKLAADQGDKDALIYLSKLENEVNSSSTVINVSIETESVTKENPVLTINFPDLDMDASEDDEDDNSDEEYNPHHDNELEKELEQFQTQSTKEHAQLRAKKHLQKEQIIRPHQTLIVTLKDYEKTTATSSQKTQAVKPEKKSEVAYETLDLVKTIFGEGTKRINTFSNIEAQAAFSDLGCTVKNKDSEDSTILAFTLTDGRIIKLKYHNPHGHGDKNLHNAMKRYFKRFLNSINKTPKTLQIKE